MNNSKYQSWIKKTLRDHLSTRFETAVDNFYTTFSTGGTLNPMPEDSLYIGINFIANECSSKALHSLERDILEKLDHEREMCKDPLAYGEVFCEMVRLYQIIHDIRFLKDATKDQIEGRHIPDSFAIRAFLPDPLENATPSAGKFSTKAQCEAPRLSAPDAVEDPIFVHKVKAKTRPEKKEPEEEKPSEPAVEQGSFVPMTARPDFPSRNVSGEEVMHLLLNNGFVVKRTTGSHYQLQHVTTHIQTTVPYHESIRRGTLHSIRTAFYRSQGF